MAADPRLDAVDRRVLAELQADGLVTMAELERRVGFRPRPSPTGSPGSSATTSVMQPSPVEPRPLDVTGRDPE